MLNAFKAFAGGGGAAAAAPAASRSQPPRGGAGGGSGAAAVDFSLVVKQLDKALFTPAYDSNGAMFEDLKAHEAARGADDLDAFCADRSAALRLKRDAISDRLEREVKSNHVAFIEGMQSISSVTMDVTRAKIHVGNSLQKLKSSKECLVRGTLGITYQRRRLERLEDLRGRLHWLRSLVRLEEEVGRACAETRFADALRAVVQAAERLEEPQAQVYALRGALEASVGAARRTLMEKLQAALEGQLVSFAPVTYAAILTAYRDMDEAGVAGVAEATEDGRRERSGTVSVGDLGLPSAAAAGEGGSGGGGRRSLLEEAGRGSVTSAEHSNAAAMLSIPGVRGAGSNLAQLATRLTSAAERAVKTTTKETLIDLLLSNLRATQGKRAAPAASASSLNDSTASSVQLGGGEAEAAAAAAAAAELAKRRADLLRCRFQDLCAQLSASDVPVAAMRIAAACSHIMHQHYLLLQWHRAPGDARSGDVDFLHRCSLEDDEAEGGSVEGDGSVSSLSSSMVGALKGATAAAALALSPASPRSSSAAPSARSAAPMGAALEKTLASLRPFLLHARSNIWLHMQQRFGKALLSCLEALGVELPLDKLAQSLVLSRDFMVVGVEYLGSGRAGSSSASAASSSAEASAGSSSGSSSSSSSSSSDADPCQDLRAQMRLLCSNYMDALNRESLEGLKGLLAQETWSRCPLPPPTKPGGAAFDFVAGSSSSLRSGFTKAAVRAIALANATLVSAGSAAAKEREGAEGSEGRSVNQCYSDGAGLLACWLSRGNPFGHLVVEEGVVQTVLPLPRQQASGEEEEEEEEEDEEDEEEDAAEAAAAGGSGAGDLSASFSSPSSRRLKDRGAIKKRRAAARFMRLVHGEGYFLELGLGRGPNLGFGVPGEASARTAALSLDSDDEEGVESPEVADSERSSVLSEDDEGDHHHGSSAARRREELEGGAFAGKGGAYAAALGGDYSHVVTISALNGFAKAVGRYVLLMEVLPVVAGDAFTGLARLFELYLYTVATIFGGKQALEQLCSVPTPAPLEGLKMMELLEPPKAFDFTDGSAVLLAGRVGAAAAEARAAEAASARGRGGAGRASGLDASFESEASTRRRGGGGGGGGGGGAEGGDSVTLHGVQLVVRGLAGLAQAQGLPTDHYAAGGPGEEASVHLGGSVNSSSALLITLRRALQQIGAVLANDRASSVLCDGVFSADTAASQPGVALNMFVQLMAGVGVETSESCRLLPERCVAAESLSFLLEVLSRVRSRVEAQLPPATAASAATFFLRATQCTTQLRGLVYHSYIPRSFPELGLLKSGILSVKWDTPNDSKANDYVTTFCGYLDVQARTLNDLVGAGKLPTVSRFGIWSAIVSHMMDCMVEGFSRVKRCNDIGRGVMSMDLHVLYDHAQRVGPTVPQCLPRDKSHVDSYIKSFYGMSEGSLTAWVEANKASYPLRHVRGLLDNGLAPSLNPRVLKHVTTAVETLFCIPLDEARRRKEEVLRAGDKAVTILGRMGEAMATGGFN